MTSMDGALEPPDSDEWIALTTDTLPVDAARQWATVAACGGVVSFCGTVRDHSDGRLRVSSLEYEAYSEYVVPKMAGVASTARGKWPELGRLALLHRVGVLRVGDVAVVVVVSAPHRREAFAAAAHCIDAVKRTVPIWKRETWPGGSDWVRCDHNGVPTSATQAEAHAPGTAS
jgi:molybdopterin synthase catalytic subunit